MDTAQENSTPSVDMTSPQDISVQHSINHEEKPCTSANGYMGEQFPEKHTRVHLEIVEKLMKEKEELETELHMLTKQLEKERIDYQERLRSRDVGLRAKDIIIEDLKNSVKSKDEEVRQAQLSVAPKDKEIANLKEMLKARDLILQGMQKSIKEGDKKVEAKRKVVMEKESHKKELETQLKKAESDRKIIQERHDKLIRQMRDTAVRKLKFSAELEALKKTIAQEQEERSTRLNEGLDSLSSVFNMMCDFVEELHSSELTNGVESTVSRTVISMALEAEVRKDWMLGEMARIHSLFNGHVAKLIERMEQREQQLHDDLCRMSQEGQQEVKGHEMNKRSEGNHKKDEKEDVNKTSAGLPLVDADTDGDDTEVALEAEDNNLTDSPGAETSSPSQGEQSENKNRRVSKGWSSFTGRFGKMFQSQSN
ncbi:cingulin-like [Branchiostoma lanceolatum]|uniref:cingulin-like n=1 Tax=Branchiostoma lanceolatum TaxID=7740 RepID=UPI0034554AC5